MGTIQNHVIIVHGHKREEWNKDDDFTLEDAHKIAKDIFPWVSEMSPEQVNGTVTFFIPPDGSKEGWSESDEGDSRREQLKQALLRKGVEVVEVAWGDVGTHISYC